MTPLLIITHEHIGPRMAGPAIRSLEIARALARKGVVVFLATPYPEARGEGSLSIVDFTWEDPQSLERWIEQAAVVMATGPVLSRVLHRLQRPLDRPTVVDLYDVREIETILLSMATDSFFPLLIDLLIEETMVYLRQGDFFLYATERQRDFWLGALWMAGRLNNQTLSLPLDRWMVQVSMGISDTPPRRERPCLKGVVPGIGPQDKVILWMGGIWEWTDPLTLGEAVELVLAQRQDVRVVFGALHHYDDQVVPRMSKAEQFLQWCKDKGWIGRYVFFLDWIPFEKRGAYLLEADVGISLHTHPIESRYAIRARTLDYLWASLPCVLSAGDELADALNACGLAKVVPPKDPRAVAEALLAWLNEPLPRAQLEEQARPLQERLRWSEVVRPLHEFLQNPRMAPDASQARARLSPLLRLRQEIDRLREENVELQELRQEIDRLREEEIALKSYLEGIRRGRIIRLLNKLYRLKGKEFL